MIVRRRPALVALGLSAALLVSACTVPADEEGKRGSEPPRIDRPATTGDDTPVTTEQGAPRGHDVKDAVFPGWGDPRIDVRSYDVTVTAEPIEAAIKGHVVIELAPTGDGPLDAFTLDLRGPVILQAIVDSMPASAEVKGHEWTIRPNAPLIPGSTTTVEIDYGGVPDQTPFRAFPGAPPTGWQPDDQGGWYTMSEPFGASNWVPVSDHPSDKATWKVTLDTPSGVTGVSNGHLLSHESRAGRTRWVWQEDEPMASYLVLAAVGAYDLDERAGPDGMQLTFAFPPDFPKAKRASFDDLDAIVTYFGDVFGPLPGRDLGAIVVDDDLGVALEVQSRPLFAAETISEGDAGPLAHELAHQWFGNDVSLEAWRDLWLNEGFATYADWLFQASGGADIDAIAATTADRFADVGLTVRDVDAAKTFDMVVYERGALTLHALRRTVGDEAFFRTMRTWVRRHSGGSATTEDFVKLASEVADRDLTAFFASWLDSPDQPELPG